MRRIDYVIENLSPINFSEKSADTIYYATKNFVPGSAMRGALANRYIALKKLLKANTDSVFRRLFLDGNIRYLPAYPVGNVCCITQDRESAGKNALAAIEPFILPLSIMKNKIGSKTIDLATGNDPGAGFKKVSGFAVRFGKELYKIEPRIQISFHMSRNEEAERFEGTSREGHIYNYEYLEPHQYFKGSIFLEDTVDSETIAVLKKLLAGNLRLGRSKNTEYGICRISEMNEVSIPDQNFVSGKPLYLYALTPYIPYGDWQNAQEAVDEAVQEIERRSKIYLRKRAEKIFAAKDYLNGFVGVWHVKRATVPVLSEGSLFPVECKDVDALAKFLTAGIGQRTMEGYGQFRLWQPFEDNVIFSVPVVKVAKPKKMPEELVKKAKKIIQMRLLQAVYQQAEQDGRQLRNAVQKQGKHICKRIEHLMDSTHTKQEIQSIIVNEFKESAKENLKKFKMSIKGEQKDLYKILAGEVNNEYGKSVMPYTDIKWENRIGISEEKKKQLKLDLNMQDAFLLNDDELFRTYWLWVMRHAVKQRPDEKRIFNSQLSEQLKGAKGGEA